MTHRHPRSTTQMAGPTLSMMMMMIILLITTAPSMALMRSLIDKNNNGVCTLNCPLDAPCVISEKVSFPVVPNDSASGTSTTEQQQQHCACPPGWTGLYCQTKYESCSLANGSTGGATGSSNSNNHRCLHGGRCVEEALDGFGNPQLVCDCSTAMTTLVESSSGTEEESGGATQTSVTRYVGKYCEHAMEQQCDPNNVDRFCVNGGDCNPNVEIDGIACICPSGYHGYHCEYLEAQVPVDKYCSLDCANGGNCVLGLVDPSQVQDLERIWEIGDGLEIFNHMQCICPPGFGGPHCQAIQESCGNDTDNGDSTNQAQFCYHGGQCVTTTTISSTSHGGETSSQTNYHCDCTTASDYNGNRFTGDYCQVPSTTVCDKTDPSFFCTHGGTCPTWPHEPCLCPDGYEGHKCEYAVVATESIMETSPISSPSTFYHTDTAAAIPILCGSITCLHGSTCLQRDGVNGPEDYCDCTTAQRPELYLAFAGNACQYQATSICPLAQEITDDNTNDASIISSFCVHHGECLQTPAADGSQCNCPDGWTGPHCEFEATQSALLDDDGQMMDPSLPICGDTVCYHGGTCVENTITVYQNGHDNVDDAATHIVQNYCDCSQANDGEFYYAGKSCEYPSTTICDDPSDSTTTTDSEPGQFFCTNHGTCLLTNLQQGCLCGTGFWGFHCEFLDLDPTDEQGADVPVPEEVLVNQCDDSLYCRNGGTCVTTAINQNGQIRQVPHCDCSTTATNITIFAGPHCEHAVTTFCTDPFEGESGSGVDLASALFCVQGGTCRDNVFEGCDCPDGWTGFRCEYPMAPQDLIDNENDDNGDDDNDDSGPPTQCGDMVCYHGGTCVTTQEEDPVSGELQDMYLCDCSTTTSSSTGLTAAETGVEIYGGPTCSTKSTSVCQGSNADDPSAALVCMNHGTCRDDPTEGCDCLPGFTGKICDLEVEDDAHQDQGVACGDTYCYHGGKCASVRITDPDGAVTTLEYCDCAFAVDENNLYAGNSCQHKSTSLCTQPTQGLSLVGTLFCVNSGTCRQGVNDTADFQQGCDCPAGWTGFSCEFPEDPQDSLNNDVPVDLEPCGHNVCLNGGTCVTTHVTEIDGSSHDVEYCNCAMAHDEDHLFAGPNCEYPSSTLCADPDPDAVNLLGTPFCVNGGTCHPDNLLGDCSCPSHWTGFRCEFPADTLDEDNSVVCGSDDDDGMFVCQQGGRCDNDGCNCDLAMEGGLRYDGPYCQYPATEYCDNPQESSVLSQVDFCVNGGTCQDGDSCACLTGYYGPRCELTINPENPPETAAPYQCRLSCANGGSCVKGVKDSSQHGPLADVIGSVAHLNMTYDESLFEHCVCPPGFIGLMCEHSVETCVGANNEEHICLHDSECLLDSSGKPYCDCQNATTWIDGHIETAFAGASCQHPASDICLVDDQSHIVGTGNTMLPMRPLYFCVNQGRCRNHVTLSDADPGCFCPVEWTGPHCEIYASQVSQLGQLNEGANADNKNGPRAGMLVWATLLLLMALLVLIVHARRLASLSKETASLSAEQGVVSPEMEVVNGIEVDKPDHWLSPIVGPFLVRRNDSPPDPYAHNGSMSTVAQDCITLAPTRRSVLSRGSLPPRWTSKSKVMDPLEPEHGLIRMNASSSSSPDQPESDHELGGKDGDGPEEYRRREDGIGSFTSTSTTISTGNTSSNNRSDPREPTDRGSPVWMKTDDDDDDLSLEEEEVSMEIL